MFRQSPVTNCEHAHVVRSLRDRDSRLGETRPCDGDLAWAAGLDSHAAVKSAFGEDVGLRRQCRAAVRLAAGIKSIETRLAAAIPAFSHADELLDWYVASGHHRLELEAARALHDMHTAIVGLKPARNAPRTVANAPINQGNAPIYAPLTDVQRSMLALIAADPSSSYDALAATLGCDRTTVMRNVRVLKAMGLLRREGSRKTGRWVVES